MEDDVKRATILLLAAVSAAATAVPVRAQTPSAVSCLVVSAAWSTSTKDAKAKQLALAAAAFYLGRLDSATTPAQFKSAYDRERRALTQKKAGPLMNSCVRVMQDKARMVETVRQQLRPKK